MFENADTFGKDTAVQLNPALFFTGNAEEALVFYRDALGGEIDLRRYKDAPPDQGSSPDWADKVMYGTLTSPYGVIAAMDAPPERAGQRGEEFRHFRDGRQ